MTACAVVAVDAVVVAAAAAVGAFYCAWCPSQKVVVAADVVFVAAVRTYLCCLPTFCLYVCIYVCVCLIVLYI